MLELEMFLNTNHVKIRQAVLCVGLEYDKSRLKEFIDCTDLDKLILTGRFDQMHAQELTESLKLDAAIGKQKLPAIFEYYSLDKLVRPEGDYALVIEALDDFDLLTDITTEEELGDYYLEDIFCGINDTVLRYIDTQRLGRDIHLESGNGTFTSYGYLYDNR